MHYARTPRPLCPHLHPTTITALTIPPRLSQSDPPADRLAVHNLFTTALKLCPPIPTSWSSIPARASLSVVVVEPGIIPHRIMVPIKWGFTTRDVEVAVEEWLAGQGRPLVRARNRERGQRGAGEVLLVTRIPEPRDTCMGPPVPVPCGKERGRCTMLPDTLLRDLKEPVRPFPLAHAYVAYRVNGEGGAGRDALQHLWLGASVHLCWPDAALDGVGYPPWPRCAS